MSLFQSSILASLIAISGTANVEIDAPIEATSERYEAAVAGLEAAMIEINTDPAQGIAELRAAIDALRDHGPLLAEDPAALELRVLAELTLARAQLSQGDRFGAAATVDASLEALGDVALEADRLGPRLGALVEERRQVQRARGVSRLRVECALPCRVLIDERNAGVVETPGSARELALPLGDHRVWISALDGDHGEGEGRELRTEVALDSADALVTLRFPGPGSDASAQAPAPRLEGGDGEHDTLGLGPAPRRIAPRWVEVTALATGAAALVAGAAVWALDSRCPGGADPNDVVACPELYDTRNAGIALVSAGFAAALTGGVMLSVDETRLGDRRGHELGLIWKARF